MSSKSSGKDVDGCRREGLYDSGARRSKAVGLGVVSAFQDFLEHSQITLDHRDVFDELEVGHPIRLK